MASNEVRPATVAGRLASFALSLSAALLTACAPILNSQSYTPISMTPLPIQRTTHCIGRFLIDLPSDFDLKTGGWGDIELYYGLDKNFQRVYATVKQGRFTNEAFWKEVNKRRFEIDVTKNTKAKASMLLKEEQLNSTSALLRQMGDKFYALSIKTEVHVLVGDRYVTLEQESYSKDDDHVTYLNADPIPTEARLKMIASKLLPYENAVRAKPGFCMQGVLFDVGQDDEVATFKFRADDHPDVQIDVQYHAVTGQPSEGILKRTQDVFRARPDFRVGVAIVREGNTKLGGGPAEEALLRTFRPVVQHLFKIERRDTQPQTLDRPFFGVKLSTGTEYSTPFMGKDIPPDTKNTSYSPSSKPIVHLEDNSSLSDEQAMDFWDRMVASVRRR